MSIQHKQYGALEYFLHGDTPRVLFLSGMHGDECESGQVLERYLQSQESGLPPFLYIPKVSPTAVAARRRVNALGNDVNRQFLPTSSDPEALAVMKLVSKHSFHVVIDLHEDPDRTSAFYLYDSGRMSDAQLHELRDNIHTSGARLYTGVDDMGDEHLRRHIERGYISLPQEEVSQESGFSSIWMMQKGIVERAFTLEIPGRASPQLKQALVALLIPFLVSSFGVQ